MKRQLQLLFSTLDPRGSTATAVGWMVACLALALSGLVGIVAGELLRNALLEQRQERAINAAEQWSHALESALAVHRQPVQTAAAMASSALQARNAQALEAILSDLKAEYPEFQRMGIADAQGHVLAATTSSDLQRDDVADRVWFQQGMKAVWTGRTDEPARADVPAQHFITMVSPIRDDTGRTIGVLGARLDFSWFQDTAGQLAQAIPMVRDGGDALVVDTAGQVVFGPAGWRAHRAPVDGEKGMVTVSTAPAERLRSLGWHVLLSWPVADETRHADDARRRVMVLGLALGALAALLGVLIARRLTRRLTALTDTVHALDPRASEPLVVPPGRDEASRLGQVFNELLTSLQQERNALATLTAELEARVQVRTREIERLADEARYAAVVRERLRIARDLHDTLAHSMMAMLMEVRMMRKLYAQNPAALPEELTRAEQAAQEGLAEARAAITRMRFNGVRDVGLGPALAASIAQFTHRTGLPVSFDADPLAASFADARAETLLRMSEEALRNVERHAQAAHIAVSLKDVDVGFIALTVEDDGAGFDVDAPCPGHYGLVGLKEQAQLIDATLTIDSRPEQGTRLLVRLRSAPNLSA